MASRKERSKYGSGHTDAAGGAKTPPPKQRDTREKQRIRTLEAKRRRRASAAAAVVGVDCGKFGHALCVRNPDLEESDPFTFPATRDGFEAAVAEIRRHSGGALPEDVLVGLEFAGVYGWTFAHYLRGLGYQVVNVLPRTTKSLTKARHGSRLKTDPADALVIVDAVAQGKFNEHAFGQPKYAELRHLASGLQRLTRLRSAAVNRTRSLLQTVWPEYEHHFGSFTQTVTPLQLLTTYPTPSDFLAAPEADVVALIRQLSRGQKGPVLYDSLRRSATGTVAIPGASGVLSKQLRHLVAEVAFFDRELEAMETLIEQALAGMPDANAILSVPGVGVASAGLFLGALGDVRAYESVRQILKLAGLNLVTKESGTSTGHAAVRISKEGRGELRKAAYFLTLTLVQKGRVFHDAYQAMLTRNGGRKKMAITALSRDALKLLYALAHDRRPFTVAPPPRNRHQHSRGG